MRTLSVLVILFCFWTVKAQKVIWSPPLSESSKLKYLKIIGQNEAGFYLVRSSHPLLNENEITTHRNGKFVVSFYDYEMHLVWERSVEVIKKDSRIICFINSDSDLKEISAEWNKSEGKFRLLKRSFGTGGKTDTTYTVFSEEELRLTSTDVTFFLATSRDKKNIVVAWRLESGSNEQQYVVLLCDASLNVIKRNLFTIPKSRKYFNPYQFLVSNSGAVFLFGIKTDPEKRNRDLGKNFFSVFSKTQESSGWTEHEINSTEHYLNDAGIAIDELNNKIVITGFYSDKTGYSTAGVFYYNLDSAMLAENKINFSSFAPGFLYKFIGEPKENYHRELVNYSIDKIILRRDGGAVIIAEANYTSDYSYYDYYLRTYISKKYYHYDNIIQLSVNKDGTMLWSRVITKEQIADDDDDTFISYTSAISDGKIYCLYNRYLKRRTQVLQKQTDFLGNEKDEALFSEEQDVYIMPSASKQVDENMLVVPAYKGKELRLAGIIF